MGLRENAAAELARTILNRVQQGPELSGEGHMGLALDGLLMGCPSPPTCSRQPFMHFRCAEEALISHESIFGDNEAECLRDALIALINAILRGPQR